MQEDTTVARESVTVPKSPTKVVTFDLATLDTLDAIGAGDSVIGIPAIGLPDYLFKYADLPKVGTLSSPTSRPSPSSDPTSSSPRPAAPASTMSWPGSPPPST